MIVYGAYGLIMAFFGGYHVGDDFIIGVLITMLGGVLAMVWSTRVNILVWAIVLIAVGMVGVAGGSAGGFLVAIGGVIGLMMSTR
jgi:hypothetical protein